MSTFKTAILHESRIAIFRVFKAVQFNIEWGQMAIFRTFLKAMKLNIVLAVKQILLSAICPIWL